MHVIGSQTSPKLDGDCSVEIVATLHNLINRTVAQPNNNDGLCG